MRQFTNVIFDLDGTLIDSAPAILETFQGVLNKNGLSSRHPLDERLIGPPLAQSLIKITGLSDSSMINKLSEDFKVIYDEVGVAATQSYPEIEEQLALMHMGGIRLHLATNKRLFPTQRILERLGLLGYFESIYTIDREIPSYINKVKMISSLLVDAQLSAQKSCYVGDKAEDAAAAYYNDLQFFLAAWGYSDFKEAQGDWCVLSSPNIMAKTFIDFNSL